MWAPVSTAARTSSSAPSMGVSGANSTSARACVYVGRRHAAAEGSRGQLALQQPEDAVLLGGSGFPLPGGVGEARQHCRRPPVGRVAAEYLDAGARPGGGIAIVQGSALDPRPGVGG